VVSWHDVSFGIADFLFQWWERKPFTSVDMLLLMTEDLWRGGVLLSGGYTLIVKSQSLQIIAMDRKRLETLQMITKDCKQLQTAIAYILYINRIAFVPSFPDSSFRYFFVDANFILLSTRWYLQQRKQSAESLFICFFTTSFELKTV